MNEERKMNRTGWGTGPWNTEPDKVVWIDPATGLDCMAHRNPMGAWCGYVAVPEGHPAFEKDYNDVDVTVHGGLTYSDHCQGNLCHEPEPGRPDNVWWLGFDCAHGGDFTPIANSYVGRPGFADLKRYREPYDHARALLESKAEIDRRGWGGGVEVYRTLPYVTEECTELAKQLKEMSSE